MPIRRNQIKGNEEAEKAVLKEWEGLHDEHTVDMKVVYEWNDLAAWARMNGQTIHFGRLFVVMVLKGSQLPPGDALRRYKYCLCFQGNKVFTQNQEVAIFQEVGSQPACMETGKAADLRGCLDGNDIQLADARCAYIQA